MALSGVGGLIWKGTAGVNRLTTGTITSERIMHRAPQLMGLAISGVPPDSAKPMFTAVRPTPTANEHHTLAFEMRPEYRPHRKGPRNEPASAPQE